MNIEEIKSLRAQLIKNKALYEETLKLYSAECEKRYKENNLSIGNDKDLDKIVDIEMGLSEKYNIDSLYKAYSKACDDFILNSLQWLIDNPPLNTAKSKIEVLTDLMEIIKNDRGKLIVYRDRLLEICLKVDFQEIKS